MKTQTDSISICDLPFNVLSTELDDLAHEAGFSGHTQWANEHRTWALTLEEAKASLEHAARNR